jgi:hypothetical protein
LDLGFSARSGESDRAGLFSSCSQREISERTGMSLSTFKSRIASTFKKLRSEPHPGTRSDAPGEVLILIVAPMAPQAVVRDGAAKTTLGGCFQPSRAPIAAAFATHATLNVVVADRQFLDDPEFLPARRTAQIAACTHRCQDSQTFGNRRWCRTPGTPLDLPMTLTNETPAPLRRR